MPPVASGGRHQARTKLSDLFTGDIKALMYAFGDVPNPYPETVAVMEDILEDYIARVCGEAQKVARAGNRQKLKVDDFKFALRHDPKKLGRVEELLRLQKEIDQARKTFDNSEGKSLSRTYDEKTEAPSTAPTGDQESGSTGPNVAPSM